MTRYSTGVTVRGRPQRRADDHVHEQYWTEADQHRFEDRVSIELRAMRTDLERLTTRVLTLFGGVIVLAFLLTLIAPFVRSWLGVPLP